MTESAGDISLFEDYGSDLAGIECVQGESSGMFVLPYLIPYLTPYLALAASLFAEAFMGGCVS